MLLPTVQDFLNRIIGHVIVTINTGIQGCVDIAVGSIVRTMHPLILLIDVTDRNLALGNPSLNQFTRIIGAAVINDKPLKIFAGLPAQALISAPNSMRPVVCRSKNC